MSRTDNERRFLLEIQQMPCWIIAVAEARPACAALLLFCSLLFASCSVPLLQTLSSIISRGQYEYLHHEVQVQDFDGVRPGALEPSPAD